jgi:hypothetical protein
MFPPKREEPDPFKDALVVYAGHKISIGIQLVVDAVWRYKMQSNEQLTVQLRDPNDNVVLEKVFTSADVDEEDKIVNVTLDGEDTSIPDGKYYLCAFVDDYLIFDAKPVIIRKVVSAHA